MMEISIEREMEGETESERERDRERDRERYIYIYREREFRISGSGSRAPGSEFRSEFWVSEFGIRDSDLGFGNSDPGLGVAGFRLRVSGVRISGKGGFGGSNLGKGLFWGSASRKRLSSFGFRDTLESSTCVLFSISMFISAVRGQGLGSRTQGLGFRF